MDGKRTIKSNFVTLFTFFRGLILTRAVKSTSQQNGLAKRMNHTILEHVDKYKITYKVIVESYPYYMSLD